MTKAKSVSLNSLNAVKASETAFEFEYIDPNGNGTGIFFSVLGGQSEKVTAEAARLINERRRKIAAREINRKIGTGSKNVEFDTVESDIEFGQRLAAIRVVGWKEIDEPCTPENALLLCQTNNHISNQIMAQSDEIANFMKL